MEIMEMEKSDLHVLHEERLKGKNMELMNSGRKRRRGTWKTARPRSVHSAFQLALMPDPRRHGAFWLTVLS
jgi:hypothetical protein